MKDMLKIIESAREHYKAVNSDIANAKDRYEHIRLTALAQSAHNLLTELIEFETGLVYAHTAGRAHEQIIERINPDTPLDLPEFKSPYRPQDPVS